ncbi:hypothetical protein ACHAQH_008798 [Verticillium albo-atrum]
MAPALHTLAAVLLRRADDSKDSSDEEKTDPHQGTVDVHDINNTAVFVVFGIIGAAFVCTGIWFFFWAKNGGFYFKENDWDDYKTTVLRRRGPNGTLLTGATPSTNLGGGSVYKDFDGPRGDHDDDDATTALSGITAGASDIAARDRREKKRREKTKERERRRRDKEHKNEKKHHDEKTEFVPAQQAPLEEDAEREAKQHLRSYRHERPARVGGLNAASEASEWDGSTNPADSTVSSTLLSNTTPPPSSRKKGGIRKVYSTADKTEDREQERIKAEARRLAERGRAAGSSRRDFSYQLADSNVSESDVGLQRGGRVGLIREESESDVGTRSYRHGIPVPNSPSAVGSDYAEEKRRNRRAGYRRER